MQSRLRIMDVVIRNQVSIPFKREGICKVRGSNQSGRIPLLKVSIPFKRESIYKDGITLYTEGDIKFQFPSNGKAYTKRPYFAPSRAVAPYTQNQTRTARGIF